MKPSRAQILVAFLAIYVVWGSTYLAIRWAIETTPPFLMAGTRFLLAGTALYAWARLSGAPRPRAAEWRGTALIGALMLLGGNGAVTWAEQRVPSGLAALLVATVPLWMVLLGGRRPRAQVVAGVILGLAGIALLVGPASFAGSGRVDLAGAGVLVCGALSWSIGSLLAPRAGLPKAAALATAMEMLAGGALLLALGVVTGEPAAFRPEAVSLRSGAALLYLVVAGSLVGFSAYSWLLRHASPAHVSTYAFVNPVVAVFLGWALAGEDLGARTLLATAVIVAGVAFIIIGPRTPAPSQVADASRRP